MRYVYFCEQCRSAFEADVGEEADAIPPRVACPKCEYPHAVKLMPVKETGSQEPGGCTPQSGC